MPYSLETLQKLSEEEGVYHVFLFEDLIKEYNYKILSSNSLSPKRTPPLSFRPPKKNLDKKPQTNSHQKPYDGPQILPLTRMELDSIEPFEMQGNDLLLLRNTVQDQFLNRSNLVSHISTIHEGRTLIELLNEFGLKGRAYTQTSGDKTYVILKGIPGERKLLKGTRYLNTHPDIVRLNIKKVNTLPSFTATLKSSFVLYNGIKILEALFLFSVNENLETSFISEFLVGIPKLFLTNIASAAAATGMAAAGAPIAVGAGIVLGVGFFSGVALDFLDTKKGITEKMTDALEKIGSKLKEYIQSNPKEPKKTYWDSLHELIFEKPFTNKGQVYRKGDYFLYNAFLHNA